MKTKDILAVLRELENEMPSERERERKAIKGAIRELQVFGRVKVKQQKQKDKKNEKNV